MTNPLVSICVPSYYANGEQDRILTRLIKSVREQTYPNIELIISDQDAAPEEGANYQSFLDGKINVKYLAYEGPANSADNTNNAIEHATGEFIHILNHDDFYYHENALRDMVAAIDKHGWVVAACLHTDSNETKLERHHIPRWPGEKSLVEGVNQIGCPSVALFRRNLNIRCQSEYALTMDCALWIDLFNMSGIPAILSQPAVVIRMWENQLSNQIDYPRSLELDKIKMRKYYGFS